MTLAIGDMEAAARDQVREKFQNELEVFDALLFHISHGCGLLTGTEHDRGLNFLHLLILNRSFNALHRARVDLLDGYPAPCLTLARSAFEDWGTMRHTAKHPETVRLYLQQMLPEYPETDQRVPPFRDIWNELKIEVGEEVWTMYGTLSEFSHPRSLGFSWSVDNESGQWRFIVGPEFDERKTRLCLHDLLMIAMLIIGLVDELLIRWLAEAPVEWQALASVLLRKGREIVDRNYQSMVAQFPELRRPPAEGTSD